MCTVLTHDQSRDLYYDASSTYPGYLNEYLAWRHKVAQQRFYFGSPVTEEIIWTLGISRFPPPVKALPPAILTHGNNLSNKS